MTGQRIIRPDTAFSVVRTKQKRPRVEDADHLKFIRSLRCCICGAPNPDPAHIKTASALHGKRETGGGEKASDKWTTPLCRTHHDEQHDFCEGRKDESDCNTAEIRWWLSKGVEPFGLALSLYACSGDDDVAESILLSNMRTPA